MDKSIGGICFVIPSLSSGGAERVVSVLASQLADDGYDVSVIKYFDTFDDYHVSPKVKVSCISKGNELDYKKLSLFKKIKLIRQEVESIKPRFIVPFLPHVAVHAFIACIGLSVHFIQTIRVAPQKAPASKLLRLLRDMLVAISYSTFVQTYSQKMYFSRLLHKKIFVLPNPISNEILSTNVVGKNNIKEIISVGRLSSQKNFPLLIKAVKVLIDAGENIELAIYGEGEDKASLQKLIFSLGMSDKCFLRGRTNDVAKVLSKSDLFVMCSNFEGMPNALMEAMAVGLPCVSTNCETGPAELLSNDKGLLVPVNDKDKIVSAIKFMIDNPKVANRFGNASKQFMKEQYGADKIAKDFIRLVILKRT